MSQLPKYPVTVKRTQYDIAVTIETRIEAQQSKVFDYVAAEGVLPEVLTGYTPFLPAVFRTLWQYRALGQAGFIEDCPSKKRGYG